MRHLFEAAVTTAAVVLAAVLIFKAGPDLRDLRATAGDLRREVDSVTAAYAADTAARNAELDSAWAAVARLRVDNVQIAQARDAATRARQAERAFMAQRLAERPDSTPRDTVAELAMRNVIETTERELATCDAQRANCEVRAENAERRVELLRTGLESAESTLAAVRARFDSLNAAVQRTVSGPSLGEFALGGAVVAAIVFAVVK